MNRFLLSAQLIERGAVRYTPAGLPALDLKLRHESTVSEDGLPRKVSVEIKALGIGGIAQPLGALALGSKAIYAGFLASTRNGRGLLFHVTALEPQGTEDPENPPLGEQHRLLSAQHDSSDLKR